MAQVLLNYLRAPELEPTVEDIDLFAFNLNYGRLVNHISERIYGAAQVAANGHAHAQANLNEVVNVNANGALNGNGVLPGNQGVENGRAGNIAVLYNTAFQHDIPLRSQPYYAFALVATEINAYPV